MMPVRLVIVAAGLLRRRRRCRTMNADAARRFVVGKMFAYTCFDGTRGAGRIYGDGSVSGLIQIRGNGPMRYAALRPYPQGQRRNGLRVGARHSVRALLQSEQDQRAELRLRPGSALFIAISPAAAARRPHQYVAGASSQPLPLEPPTVAAQAATE